MGGANTSAGRAVVLLLVLVVASGIAPSAGGSGAQSESVEIFNPRGIYFAGQDVEVSGAAVTGIDGVALYVRDQGDWELLDLSEDGRLDDDDVLAVDNNGTWRRGGVVLSNASRVLARPGFYRLGVIDAVDATDENGTLLRTMTTDQFVSGTSTQHVISVRQPLLEGAFQSVNGQVATEDAVVEVQGIARGLDEVLVVMVDSRGAIATERLPVRGPYDVFDDDVALETAEERALAQGSVIGVVIGLGRDRVAGDGSLPGYDAADGEALESYVDGIDSRLSQQQILERIYRETTDESGSDDLSIFRSFQYTGGVASVETVTATTAQDAGGINEIEVGETMLIRGTTNRKPDDNTIRVEVVDGPSAERLDIASTDDWGVDGMWMVEIAAADVEPGRYVIRTEVGDQATDIDEVWITEPGPDGVVSEREPPPVSVNGDAPVSSGEGIEVGAIEENGTATETETEAEPP